MPSDNPTIGDLCGADELRWRAEKSRQDMELSGASSEPTLFKYYNLSGFYNSAIQAVESCIKLAKEKPGYTRTFEERKRQIGQHLTEVVEFQSAWTILQICGYKITAEEFKNYNPSKRKELFLDALQQNPEKFSQLINAREKAIKLCAEQGILPKDYF